MYSYHLRYLLLVVCVLVGVGCVVSSSLKIRGGSVSERFREQGGTTLADQLALAQSTCLIGLRGVNCGLKGNQLSKAFEGDDGLIVAGNGYDRWTHQVKPQIIQSKRVTVMPQAQEQSLFVGMSSAREFYSQLYPINGQSTFFNGLYSHNGGADEMFSRYFEGTFNVYDSQKQYITHQVASHDSANVTLLFKRIIEILPTSMDVGIYQQVIETFGDSVTTQVDYGGVVDSTVSVRQCFSDGNMENYIKDELHAVTTGATNNVPDGYGRYHKVSSLDIVGGNPEISSIPQRVASFANNPVPVRFQTVPIWTVFPEGEKRNNMKQVYDQYVNSKSNMADQMVQHLENRKNEEQRQPKLFRAFIRNKQGTLQEFGQFNVAVGQKLEIYQLTSKYLGPVMFDSRNPVSIVRHEDNYFHVEVQQYVPGTVPNTVSDHAPAVVYSNTVINWCASLPLPMPKPIRPFYFYPDWDEIVVCSGGQIMLAGDQRSVLVGCPYVY